MRLLASGNFEPGEIPACVIELLEFIFKGLNQTKTVEDVFKVLRDSESRCGAPI